MWRCSSSLPTRREHAHAHAHTRTPCVPSRCSASSAFPTAPGLSGSRARPRSWVHPETFIPSSPAARKKGCSCQSAFGGKLFWESPPELLLVLMLCDNNLSCLSLVCAGHEKALCAARGDGCQLGSVRRSLGAPWLHRPRQRGAGCPRAEEGSQKWPPHRRGSTAPRVELPGAFCSSHVLDGGNAVVSWGCFTSSSSRQTFPSKENISSSWCHLPPGCLCGICSSKKSLRLRCHQRRQIKPILPLCVWSREVLGDEQASHCLHLLLPKEQHVVPKGCQRLRTCRQLAITCTWWRTRNKRGRKCFFFFHLTPKDQRPT